jgi:hypothetical protein
VISRTTKEFWKLFDGLPQDVQRHAIRAYTLWRSNAAHPSLHFKCISEKHSAYSVRVGIHWRALGYRDDSEAEDTIVWFWIGSHAEYDKLIAGL